MLKKIFLCMIVLIYLAAHDGADRRVKYKKELKECKSLALLCLYINNIETCSCEGYMCRIESRGNIRNIFETFLLTNRDHSTGQNSFDELIKRKKTKYPTKNPYIELIESLDKSNSTIDLLIPLVDILDLVIIAIVSSDYLIYFF